MLKKWILIGVLLGFVNTKKYKKWQKTAKPIQNLMKPEGQNPVKTYQNPFNTKWKPTNTDPKPRKTPVNNN